MKAWNRKHKPKHYYKARYRVYYFDNEDGIDRIYCLVARNKNYNFKFLNNFPRLF